MLYTDKGLARTLADWHVHELQALASLGDRLVFKPSLRKAIEQELACQCLSLSAQYDRWGREPCKFVDDDFPSHCLPWAQSVGYEQLAGVLIRCLAHKRCPGNLQLLSPENLIKVIRHLQEA